MKRKKFIAVAAGVAVVGVPALYYYKKSKKEYNTPQMPGMLGLFCDEKTLKEIGAEYLKKMPAENNKQALTGLLLTAADGKLLKESDKSAVSELLDTKTKQDFAQFKTLTLRGWVISETEARQCALFSLT